MSVFYGSWPMVYISNLISYRPYTQRTVPGYAAIRGSAATNATITVNERPTFRQGTFFYGGDYADNTDSAVYKDLEVYAAINPSGTNTPDIVSATTGTVFIARTPETFTYDADGNMTSDGRFHYFWNGENRLVCASNSEYVMTYAYDHRGRMVRKEISRGGAEARRIEYLWDDWNIIRETTIDNCQTVQPSNCQTDYVWGLDLDGTLQGAGGVGGLLAVVRDDGVFLPTYDANGNVSEYVSTNGTIVAHYDYSPFGEPLVASGELAATFTHQFSTKPYCAVTGFSEYQMRKYNPEIGRWLSRDPIGEKSFSHTMFKSSKRPVRGTKIFALFPFVANGPVNTFDLLGLDNPGCDLPDEINPELISRENKDCYRKCCAKHDECYYKNNCTMLSWGHNLAGLILSISGCRFCSLAIAIISPCSRCNSQVVACFAGCCTGIYSPPETQKKWFCPNGPHKGEYYDDWEDIPASCWNNGIKPDMSPEERE